ncbi:MAG: hypothetical protein A3C93_02195 [Candidatus Lloydbacteria bacterium RIFCSPHIGHO2_02_FULL_54_17]|uniref:Uncharacterized protein n=1 Tax=Candidatus Lloydbacteria bacterium RIFCSPHIGHO2_02_FULL_54_17 TaxID=1798664 RepID=A0A1G2DDL1_9BACT|nr:MAG: hypothetical protein A2762_02215 [Candidatus Lloydbacteria bacterium RIFCSPHIGHO2_01_FULL_54_11]OGZ11724.1 MAG: hypothetical protein A3C93_02195 [Candidatus Lloydbacteria bacterium RIFCSPHIGHO2_02_FULL_54_17]OGZ14253.1 MAG: hypothetical protein A2948_01530 [Candidatus Lloydbacteria bacterium RIFCSPLOWO2_01_FULL_54_18]OGZ16598.1 MAG: hypothetical protein A3H76_04170 [Candidatus Lloydbacteria bacterium RIFCSPLOWO2_02_FULL_54_12]
MNQQAQAQVPDTSDEDVLDQGKGSTLPPSDASVFDKDAGAGKPAVTIDPERMTAIEAGEVEPTPEEEAILLTMGYTLESVEEEVVYTDKETGLPLTPAQIAELETGKSKRRRRRRGKGRHSGAATAEASNGATPAPAAASEEKAHEKDRRVPSSGGIRKIEIVPVALPPSPPSGSIGLRRFLRLVHPGQLTDLAKEVVEKGAVPDVVVWSKSSTGFDHARVEVVLVNGKDRQGNPMQHPNLKVTEAMGRRYENLSGHIGRELRYGEVMNFVGRDGKPRYPIDRVSEGRRDATVALNAVLVEALQRLLEAEARKQAPRTPRKAEEK